MAVLPPIILPDKPRPWSSSGVREKPPGCKLCRWTYSGTGFCPDKYGPETKVAILLPFPGNDEILEQKPLAGGVGKFFLWKFVHEIGRKTEEVGVSFVLRCKPPLVKGRPAYPTGTTRTLAESCCRQYDGKQAHYLPTVRSAELVPGGLRAFDPDVFIVSFDPADVFNTPAFTRQVRKDMQCAFRLADAGRRPLVLMGAEATELFLPFTAGRGGCKAWRGTVEYTTYPFKSDKPCDEGKMTFPAATNRYSKNRESL